MIFRSLLPSTYSIRDGNYGGLMTFFNEDGSEVVIVSPLNQFMISNLRYRRNEDPEVRKTNKQTKIHYIVINLVITQVEVHPGVFDYGLMGSIKSIPRGGMQLETVMVRGSSFSQAFSRWGEILRTYHGRPLDLNREDIVSDYLGRYN